MPGFVGIIGKDVSGFQPNVSQALAHTVYSQKVNTHLLHTDIHLVLGQSYFNFITQEQSSTNGKQTVWCDGEIYNKTSILTSGESFTAAILRHYRADTLLGFMKNVNGVFLIVLYDEATQCVLFITDRYGLKPFYYSQSGGNLILTGELKCFTAFPFFKVEIRRDVVDCFLNLEHMMGSATWFTNVELTEPAKLYQYSIADATLKSEHYWSWSDVKPVKASLEDASEEMGRLLQNAIEVRYSSHENMGIGLSGGFDSRAILAASQKHKPITYTFGTKQSADVKIANRVAQIANVKNIHLDMNVPNWLQKRFRGVWKVDGMLNMYHMHYSHLMNEIPKFMDVNLSGFLGDGMLGQTYLFKKGKFFLDKRIDNDIARHYYGDYCSFSNPTNPFFNINKVDAYFIYNRGRRLTGLGMEEANKTIYQRMPFMDNALMDFSHGVSDALRKGNTAYHLSLLNQYPEFFRNIPHATSGLPINLNPNLIYKSQKMLNRWMWIFKFKMGMATSFTDVYNWLKEPVTAQFVRDVLNPKTALYPNFTDIDFLNGYFEPHMSGKSNYMKKTMSALTMEIWLQQIINKKFIHDEA